MSFDLAQLRAACLDPAVIPLTDADAAALLSTPTLVPRVAASKLDFIDSTKLADILGTSKAVMINATLKALIVAGAAAGATAQQQQQGAQSGYVLDVLNGAGFDPQNAAVPPLMQQFVAAGVITSDDAAAITRVPSYRAGGPVTADDVASARLSLANTATLSSRLSGVASWASAETAKIQAWAAGGYQGVAPAVSPYTGA